MSCVKQSFVENVYLSNLDKYRKKVGIAFFTKSVAKQCQVKVPQLNSQRHFHLLFLTDRA